MLWTKAAGRTVAGLTRRREAEAALIFDGGLRAGGFRGCGGADARRDGGRCRRVAGGPRDARVLPRADRRHRRAGQQCRGQRLPEKPSRPRPADGVVGPATRASIARDIAARRGAATTAGAAAASAATAAIGNIRRRRRPSVDRRAGRGGGGAHRA
ncbi:MAG: hypothetical protein WDM84_07585 [Bauldia sp.]